MILINKTYSIVTPESAENGEDSDSGFLSKNEKSIDAKKLARAYHLFFA